MFSVETEVVDADTLKTKEFMHEDKRYVHDKHFRITEEEVLEEKRSVLTTNGETPHPDPRISSFGATKERTKKWRRKRYTGSFDFKDGTKLAFVDGRLVASSEG